MREHQADGFDPDLAAELSGWDALSDEALELFEASLLSEPVLAREWNTPEKDEAWDALNRLIGSIDGPADWSLEHDHYLYGTPKRYSNG